MKRIALIGIAFCLAGCTQPVNEITTAVTVEAKDKPAIAGAYRFNGLYTVSKENGNFTIKRIDQ